MTTAPASGLRAGATPRRPATRGLGTLRPTAPERTEPLLRLLVGATFRRRREEQGRTLASVAAEARVSIAYLSEIERGRKEPSSEVLVAVCHALGMRLADLLVEAADELRAAELRRARRPAAVSAPARRAGSSRRPRPAEDGAATRPGAVAAAVPAVVVPAVVEVRSVTERAEADDVAARRALLSVA